MFNFYDLAHKFELALYHFCLVLSLMFFLCTTPYANPTSKQKWYRYYDHKGIANISSHVSDSIFDMVMTY